MDSRLFQDALKLAEDSFGAEALTLCLPCHSPVAVKTGDLALKRKVSWEGVTCDYCHSIRQVTSDGHNLRASVSFSKVKSGPSKEAVSGAHDSAYSEVHVSSIACASCHEYRNRAGLGILTTYSEWKGSPAAKAGKQCQSCHMYRVQGDVVDPSVKRVKDTEINLHEMPGSHSAEQLNKAVRARLLVNRENGRLNVSVELTNKTRAHFVPTGSPLRQLILELTVDPHQGPDFREKRVYRRVVVDAKGNVLQKEHLALMDGARTTEDSRLAPTETRVEKFSFDVPEGVAASVEASLWYYYSPLAQTAAKRRKKFLTVSRFIR